MKTFIKLVALVSCLLLAASCRKEMQDTPASGQNILITAKLPECSKIGFEEDASTHALKGSWIVGDEVFGFSEQGGTVAFCVVSVDPETGTATLGQTGSKQFSPGEKLYVVYCPGKGPSDIDGTVLDIDFSKQTKDAFPALMLSEAEVEEGPSISFSFRNAVALVGIVRPEIDALNTHRKIVKVIASGHEIVSSGRVSLSEGKLKFTPGAPSNFVTREVDEPLVEGPGGKGTIENDLLLAVPSCSVGKVTMLDDKGVIYTYDTGGKTATGGKYCRIGEGSFEKMLTPVLTDVAAGGVYWADRNLGATEVTSGSAAWGDIYRWGDYRVIYTEKTKDAITFDADHPDGYTKPYTGEIYYDGSSYTKYNATDSKTVLDPVDDIVQLTYPGSGWRMPTIEEFNALNDGTLSREFESEGRWVKYSDAQGNYVYFNRAPKGGKEYGDMGRLWTSTVHAEGSAPYKTAKYFRVNKTSTTTGGTYRYYGYSVRPVLPDADLPKGGGGGSDEPDLPNYNEGKSLAGLPSWTEISIDYTNLTEDNHPRLLLRNKDIKAICTQVGDNSNPNLTKIHDQMLKAARSLVKNTSPLTYEITEGGRLLFTSRKALRRIVSLAYAYRITGEERYLQMADWNIRTVCNFPSWHPDHFLDVAEMAAGVALGYDWLYDDLPEDTRDLASQKLKEYALDPGDQGNIYSRGGNWNQVCNGGLLCAALAIYEKYPSDCDKVIRKALASNAKEIKAIYSPSGAYAEGPGYWEYGTTYQGLINLSCESALGTDFELTTIDGFDKTALFYLFDRGTSGLRFNYSDSGEKDDVSIALWYLAYKYKKGSYLYLDRKTLEDDTFSNDNYSYLALVSCYRMGPVTISAPSGTLYKANGANPVLMCRTGWESKDLYLAIKGGEANISHAHMDVGEIVFDAFGTRWIKDFTYSTNYEELEKLFTQSGINPDLLGNREADSPRWKVFQYNNRRHSTLTVNGKDHWPYGVSGIEKTELQGKLGGQVDLTNIFYQQLATGNRTALIRDGQYLEITDALTTLSGAAASVRFVCATSTTPTVVSDGILLTDSNGVVMKLTTDAPSAEFRIWSSDPLDSTDYTSPFTETDDCHQKPLDGYLCGYEYSIPEGKKTIVTTTLKKQ